MTRLLSLVLLACPALAAAAPPAVTAVAYHPRGKVVAFGTHGEVRQFDPSTGAPLGQPSAVPGRVTALAFDPRGKWLAAAGGESGKAGTVLLFRLGDDGRADRSPLVTITGHKDSAFALA